MALNGAEKEISHYSYLHYKMNVAELDKRASDGTEKYRATTEETISGIDALIDSIESQYLMMRNLLYRKEGLTISFKYHIQTVAEYKGTYIVLIDVAPGKTDINNILLRFSSKIGVEG